MRNIKIFIVGAGAVGSNYAELLVRQGYADITVIDDDKLESDNLLRCAVYTTQDLGEYKVEALQQGLERINSDVRVNTYVARLSDGNLQKLLPKSRNMLVIDATDNLETRFVLNKYCVSHNIHVIYNAVRDKEGFLLPFAPGTACFDCVYAGKDASAYECGSDHVDALVARMLAVLGTNIISNLFSANFEQKLFHINLLNNTLSLYDVLKRSDCTVCGNVVDMDIIIVRSCTAMPGLTAAPRGLGTIDLDAAKTLLQKEGYSILETTPAFVMFKKEYEYTLYRGGKLLVKDLEDKEDFRKRAMTIYNIIKKTSSKE